MPSKLRRYDESGHIHFLTISCYRRLQFFRHDPVKLVFVDGMDNLMSAARCDALEALKCGFFTFAFTSCSVDIVLEVVRFDGQN
jgi:hypothetical protein